jgi:hypothetical protein
VGSEEENIKSKGSEELASNFSILVLERLTNLDKTSETLIEIFSKVVFPKLYK